jgi:hypothetical protein
MIDAALYALLSGDATLMALVSKVYNTVAYEPGPNEVSYPHLVFWWQGGPDEYTLTQRIRTIGRYELRVVGEATSMAAMQSALARAETLLMDHAFDGTMYCRRLAALPNSVRIDAGVTHVQVGATYQIEVR